MIRLEKYLVLYDWVTVSIPCLEPSELLDWCGLQGLSWDVQDGSKLHYAQRMSCDGITVHYSPPEDSRHNVGCCLEMSGCGCRRFESSASISIGDLLEWAVECGYKVTRLDIALDDFCGLIDLRTMAGQARRFEYTAQCRKVRIMEECDSGEPEHLAISVCHGSKSSEIYVRCYDKRAERNAWDELPHWVRLEVQLRGSNCIGWLLNPASVGEKLRGVLANYLQYRDPAPDSNKARWPISRWWSRLLQAASAIRINTPCDTEYNRDRLNAHVYDRNHNAIATAILSDGLPAFLHKTFGAVSPAAVPSKYTDILAVSAPNVDLAAPPARTMLTLGEQLQEWSDVMGFDFIPYSANNTK